MGYSRLEPGRELEVREYISFQRGRDGFCELIECSVDELLERKAESIVREKELCQRIDAAVEVWSKQAQQTQQYMKALEYVKTPPTPHTSNRWTVNEYGNHEMSNMVYRFSWREYEHTEWDRTLEKSVPKSWELTWSVTFNTPHNPDYSGDGWKIAGQDRKIFRDRASMEKYLQNLYKTCIDRLRKPCYTMCQNQKRYLKEGVHGDRTHTPSEASFDFFSNHDPRLCGCDPAGGAGADAAYRHSTAGLDAVS